LVAASSLDFSDFVDGVSSASFTALAYGLVVCLRAVISASVLLYLLCGFGLVVFPYGVLFCIEGFWSLLKKIKKKT